MSLIIINNVISSHYSSMAKFKDVTNMLYIIIRIFAVDTLQAVKIILDGTQFSVCWYYLTSLTTRLIPITTAKNTIATTDNKNINYIFT